MLLFESYEILGIGFYIFGNINTLKTSSPLWTNISKTLEDKAAIGSSLTLKCENHSDQITMIVTPEDFQKVPEGGCLMKCNQNFRACGHPCPRMCHGYDREHIKAACQLKCERIICDLGHVCPLKCAQECKPCTQLIEKTLPCEHIKQIFCHQEPDDPKIVCTTTVTVTLADCGHEVSSLLQSNTSRKFRDNSLDCIVSYLTDRVQRVDISGKRSPRSKVKMGVPQGSMLGPSLFLIYINDRKG
ncbi:unnamed protein product [Diatraea saccharalis]|uniref:Reverse transcriptase domain-containing protein n=1 Tax=Diatraea saccharalis TaxID=40085 RepID=A0A9N9QZQ8_9NEOP|nr:unnamed protein product [Diatraea saccharalis]